MHDSGSGEARVAHLFVCRRLCLFPSTAARRWCRRRCRGVVGQDATAAWRVDPRRHVKDSRKARGREGQKQGAWLLFSPSHRLHHPLPPTPSPQQRTSCLTLRLALLHRKHGVAILGNHAPRATPHFQCRNVPAKDGSAVSHWPLRRSQANGVRPWRSVHR